MTRKLLTCLALLFGTFSFAQDYKRTQNWYFGDKAGLSFATNPPTVLTDGAMSTIEGCATISDTAGNLLFYTNGLTVWNKNHQVMENGTGLKGDPSSTQSTIIIPQPGNDSIYFIFTTTDLGRIDGLQYSTVNINENNNTGKVIIKNTPLITPICEKLTATKHVNGRDYWILVHGFGNDLFYAYLITEHGIVDCPVVSKIGSVHSNNSGPDAQGSMAFSYSSRLLAVSNFSLNEQKVDLFDFDASQGLAKNYVNIPWVNMPYGISFSKSEEFLYVSTHLNRLLQYNISSGNSVAIKNSEFTLYNGPNTIDKFVRGLQIGVNGKIYLCFVDSQHIAVTNYPDSAGSACDFEEKGVDLSFKVSKYGLPNFVSSYFYRPAADFDYTFDCETNTALFQAKDTFNANSFQWNISKSGSQVFSGSNITYTFPDTGEYTIQLLAINGSDSAIREKKIFVQPTYKLELGNDTVLCSGQSLMLDAGSGQYCYLWSDSSRGSNLNIDTSGLYHVKVVSNAFCTSFDSIHVSFIPEPSASISISQSGDTLFGDQGFDHYIWFQNNNPAQDSSLNYLILNSKGNYKVTGTDSLGCFSTSSSVFTVDRLTSIERLIQNSIKVFPNPSSAETGITISSSQALQSIELYSIQGKFIQTFDSNAKNILLKNLAKGIYTLVIDQSHYIKIIIN